MVFLCRVVRSAVKFSGRMSGDAESSSVASALASVNERIKAAVEKRPERLRNSKEPRLVAVSKTKPESDIVEAYVAGQRHFGENYVQELVGKSASLDLLEKAPEIKWHFIGHLQRNKAKKLVSCPNLFVVETVDSDKLADALNSAMASKSGDAGRLKIMVQVNTSGEEGKSGVEPQQATPTVQHVLQNCPRLEFIGLMTIGDYEASVGSADAPNPDFLKLVEVRDTVCKDLGLDVNDLELSMGMSADFEQAIEFGSTNVRVGSTIFGARNYKKPPSPSPEGKKMEEVSHEFQQALTM